MKELNLESRFTDLERFSSPTSLHPSDLFPEDFHCSSSRNSSSKDYTSIYLNRLKQRPLRRMTTP